MIFSTSRPATKAGAAAYAIEFRVIRTLFAVAFVALTLVGCSAAEQPGLRPMSIGIQPAHVSSWSRTPDTKAMPPHVIVQSGETLHTIAHRHKLSVYGFMTVNELNGPRIYPGQRLYLPTH